MNKHRIVLNNIFLLRHIDFSKRVLSAMRNLVILSSILALGFFIGLIPVGRVQQYLFVIINGLSGVFIFISSVLFNKKITQSLVKTF